MEGFLAASTEASITAPRHGPGGVLRHRAAWIGAGLVAVYAVLTLAATYPVVTNLGTHHIGEGGGDARVYLWNMWWVRRCVVEAPGNPFFTDRIFHPIGVGLALHTLGLLQGLEFIPLAGAFGDVAGANLVVLTTFVLSALGTYGLARATGVGCLGAFVAGMVFAFCPARLTRLAGHYDLLGTEWIPVAAWLFCGAIAEGRKRAIRVAACGAAVAACGYTNLTYLVFLALLGGLFVVWSVFRGPLRRALAVSAAASGLAGLLLAPLLLSAVRDLSSWAYPHYSGSDLYAADVLGYLVPGPNQLLGSAIGRTFGPNPTEAVVFVGYVALGLAVIGVFLRESSRRLGFWALAAGVFLALSLGDRLMVGGNEVGGPLPFALVRRLPLLEQLRAPSRFSIVVMLSLALAAGAAWSKILGMVRGLHYRIAATVAVAAVSLSETAARPVPTFRAGVAPMYRSIASEPGDTALIEIPGIDQAAGRIMYDQTAHGKPILIGFVARVPVEKTSYFYGLPLIRPLIELRKGRLAFSPDLVARERASAVEAARFLDIGHVVVDRSIDARGVSAFVESVLPVERAYEDPFRIGFRVRREALPPSPWSISAGGLSGRMHFERGWTAPVESEGRIVRRARGMRSSLLLRRPSGGPLDLLLRLGGRGEATVVAAGRAAGTLAWQQDWEEVRIGLPDGAAEALLRVELSWKRPAEGTGAPSIASVRLARRDPALNGRQRRAGRRGAE
jgi:hypothetical protein